MRTAGEIFLLQRQQTNRHTRHATAAATFFFCFNFLFHSTKGGETCCSQDLFRSALHVPIFKFAPSNHLQINFNIFFTSFWHFLILIALANFWQILYRNFLLLYLNPTPTLVPVRRSPMLIDPPACQHQGGLPTSHSLSTEL